MVLKANFLSSMSDGQDVFFLDIRGDLSDSIYIISVKVTTKGKILVTTKDIFVKAEGHSFYESTKVDRRKDSPRKHFGIKKGLTIFK